MVVYGGASGGYLKRWKLCKWLIIFTWLYKLIICIMVNCNCWWKNSWKKIWTYFSFFKTYFDPFWRK